VSGGNQMVSTGEVRTVVWERKLGGYGGSFQFLHPRKCGVICGTTGEKKKSDN